MAEATLPYGLLEKIILISGSYAFKQIGLAWGMKGEFTKLRNKLIIIRGLLLDAEKQEVGNSAVRECLKRLKDVVYDADDVLDRVKTEELLRKVEIHGSKRREVSNFFTRANYPLKFRFSIGRKIKHIRERVDEIVTEMKKLGFVERVLDRDSQVEVRLRKETSPYSSYFSNYSVRSSDIVGQDTDKAAIIEKLKRPNPQGQNVSIIPIVGMGGLGKTTLARSVYDSFANQFEVSEWVCVSDDFDIEKIVRQISKDHGEPLQSQNTLGGKKFLLVLDDVRNEDATELEAQLNSLMVGASGSKIVVTTRSKRVASIMARGTVDPHEIKGLSDDDCLKVFLKWAFSEGEREKHPELIEIGEDIVKKCKGVPLAARTLGCMLNSKTSEKDWEGVRDNEIWKLPQKEHDILPALKLSYDQMSSSLKQCFAYCSLFPKDENIYRKDLVARWMAQGLVESSDKNEELEDIGDRYFDELVRRSFLEEDRGTESHRMHDLVHELAQLVAESECVIHTSISQRPQISETTRHASFGWRNSQSQITSPHSLSYRPTNPWMLWHGLAPEDHFVSPLKQELHLTPLHQAKKLRTLCLPPDMDPTLKASVSTLISTFTYLPLLHIPLISHSTFKYLRLLDIPYFQMKVLPSSIGNLKHLRYLSLDSNSVIQKLPNSLCKLVNLQTLNLNGCKSLRNLPTNFGNLISLRYLLISPSIDRLSEKAISNLTSLRTLKISSLELIVLPEGIQHLSRLRTLDIRNCPKLVSLPKGMLRLIALESLCIGSCRQLNILADDLKGLCHLQDLRLTDLPKLVTLSLPKGLEDAAAKLQQLLIDKCERLKTVNYLENLTSLRSLKVYYCPDLLSLSEGIHHLKTLRVLIIKNCDNLVSLPKGMGALTALEILDIAWCVDLKFVMDANDDLRGLCHLRELVLNCLQNLVTLGHLKNLTSLVILEVCNCPDLLSLPDGMHCLRVLKITGCDKLLSLPKSMGQLTTLEILNIRSCKKLKFLKDDLKGLCHLRELFLTGLPNLVTLGHLKNLTSLVTLRIFNCTNLLSLPKGMDRLTALRSLEIATCPHLSTRCKIGGEDWYKISHVPNFYLDWKRIRKPNEASSSKYGN